MSQKNTNNSIEQLTKRIRLGEDKLSSNQATRTKTSVSQGIRFRRLKQKLKEKKKNFLEHNKDSFPYISNRTIQRYMAISQYVKLREYTALSLLSQTCLLTILRVSGKRNVGKYLAKRNIKMNFDITDFDKAIEFKKQVEDIIKKAKRATKHSGKAKNKKAFAKGFDAWLSDLITKDFTPNDTQRQRLTSIRDKINKLLKK